MRGGDGGAFATDQKQKMKALISVLASARFKDMGDGMHVCAKKLQMSSLQSQIFEMPGILYSDRSKNKGIVLQSVA